MNDAFRTTPLSPGDWSICVAPASIGLWADELRKLAASVGLWADELRKLAARRSRLAAAPAGA